MESIRRIITGIDENGRSVFVSDETIAAKSPPLLTGNQILELFGSDDIPTVPNTGAVEQGLRFFPTTPEGIGSSSSPTRPTRTGRRCPTTSSGRPRRPTARRPA